MKKLLVFDMDGTLIDSDKSIIRCLKQVGSDFGYDVKYVSENIGVKKLEEILAMNSIPEGTINEILEKYRECYLNQFKLDTVPMEGAYKTLKELNRGNVLGILTFKNSFLTRQILNHFFEGITFQFIVGGNDNISSKAEGLKRIISESGIPFSQSYYIGDRSTDMKAAMECGINGIWIKFGLGEKDEFNFPFKYRTAHSFEEIPSLL